MFGGRVTWKYFSNWHYPSEPEPLMTERPSLQVLVQEPPKSQFQALTAYQREAIKLNKLTAICACLIYCSLSSNLVIGRQPLPMSTGSFAFRLMRSNESKLLITKPPFFPSLLDSFHILSPFLVFYPKRFERKLSQRTESKIVVFLLSPISSFVSNCPSSILHASG